MANTLIVKGYTRQNTLTKVGNKTEISAKFARTQRAEKQMNGDLLYKKRRGGKRRRKGGGRRGNSPQTPLPTLLSLSLFACGQVEVGNGHKQLELELKAWIVWIVVVVVVFGSPSC